jgi:hypothetical protein
MNDRLFTFVGGEIGFWRVVEVKPVIGETLADVKRLNVVNGAVPWSQMQPSGSSVE